MISQNAKFSIPSSLSFLPASSCEWLFAPFHVCHVRRTRKIKETNQQTNTVNPLLRTFALNVSAHPYCAHSSLRDVMPRHTLSARAVEEMWRYIALVITLISMHAFNSLKCSVTPYFLLIDHFLSRLSTFCEKLKKICVVEV